MPAVKDIDLLKELKAKSFKRAYYFYGKDVFAVESCIEKLVTAIHGKESDPYNDHRFTGKGFSVSEFSDAAEALPMFSDRVSILVNDLNAEELSADDLSFLIETIENLPESTTAVFYYTAFDVTGGKRAISGKNKKLSDACGKAGAVCEFAEKKPEELSGSIVSQVSSMGAKISKENASYLAALCLSNRVLIANELLKLSSYTNGGEITKQVIDLLVSKQLDSNAFALARAVTSFKTGEALRLLDELFAQRIEPISICSALAMSFSDLYRAKTALEDRKTAEDVIRDFGYKSNRTFAVNNAFRDVRRISVEQLRRCIRILKDTDSGLKLSRGNGRYLLEEAVVKMASTR